ncbi:MAG: hypothetical protein ACPGVU_15585 [Limisphaerales bacterium]
MSEAVSKDPAALAHAVRDGLPKDALFAERAWRISPTPFPLSKKLLKDLEFLGRVILKFYRATNLLYRRSLEGKEPAWVAEWLDRGKPNDLLEAQRHASLKNDVPRVIRPDILLTADGFSITELDSVPGGIGLTGCLGQVYAGIDETHQIVGGANGMIEGFESIFGDAPEVHLMVSEESATYRPEMEWLAGEIDDERFRVHDSDFTDFREGDAVYRFFELFDLENVSATTALLDAVRSKQVQMTPPFKPVMEEKMLLALLWNRNLHDFWRRELGEAFFQRMQQHVPYSWVVDPTPLPPQGAIPRLNLTDWTQLKGLSQKQRNLILKVSGFSEEAWGARGVHYGSDLSVEEWSGAVDRAIESFPTSPYVLQDYHKPRSVNAQWFDFESEELREMKGRVRLCPYYFVTGNWDQARTKLGGVLATVCPADKKIIHGMTDAILAPCTEAIGASAAMEVG